MHPQARLLLVLVSVCGSIVAHAGDPSAAITAIASLTDPTKLATLKGERAANTRVNKIMAWMEEARRAGTVPSKSIDEAQKQTADQPAHAAAVKESLLRNFEFCERNAIFSDDNLTRMKQGHSPLVLSGSFKGQPYEVDHIIPLDKYPALGNEIANLIYLPRTLNRRKGDDIKQRAIDLGQRLLAAGILTKQEYEQLKVMTQR